MKNSGGYKVRNGVIYVFGTISGKRYRFSTNLQATNENLLFIARNYWSVLLNKIDEKNAVKEPSYKLSDFLLEMLNLSAHKRSKAVQDDYISKAKRLILPYFKGYGLKDITPLDLEKWQSELLKNYSTTTVKRLKNILNMALNKATLNDIIPKNPLLLVDGFRVYNEKKEPYTIDEMQKILTHSKGWLNIFLHLAFTTGLRTGELLALKYSDIDWQNKLIFVNRTMTKGQILQSNSIKNHNRFVILADYLVEILKDYDSGSEWLFPSRLGTPYSESKAIAKHYFKPLLQSIGVEYKTLYATRHTFVSILRNHGVSREFVAELAGHSQEVSDKHYYTAQLTNEKIRAVNNVFFELNLGLKAQSRAHQ
ncbi:MULTISPECIES: tyrosine-type recombinase/integrase [unclassified Campylobacter]|uniref:tyrosine-type recombinase/integrase n=1 Tax=unclassified Campylobacter TaxID=2593542 RepID=UPI003D33DC0F